MNNIYDPNKFIETYTPGTIVQVQITHLIKPSQIITTFNGDFIGRLSILDISNCLPESEAKFKSYRLGDLIECVILNINIDDKQVKLSQKHLIVNELKQTVWDKISLGDEMRIVLVAQLYSYMLVKTETDVYGILSNEYGNETQTRSYLVQHKLDDSGLLSFISTETEIELPVSENTISKTEFTYIDEELTSYEAFSSSILGTYASSEEHTLIENGFSSDSVIFSKELALHQILYIEFQNYTPAYENDLKRKALQHFFPELLFDEDSEKRILFKLSSSKYWFKLNKYHDKNQKTEKAENIVFTLFNEDISILVTVVETKNTQHPRFIIKNINIGNDWTKTAETKKRHTKNGAFLLSSTVAFATPYMSVPIGVSQRTTLDYLLLKTDCFNAVFRIKKESGEILRTEGHTLGIIDKFLEYQINQLDERKEGSVFVDRFEQIPSTREGISIKFNVALAEEYTDFEGDPVVNVRVKQPSLKEDQEEELVRVGDGTLNQLPDGYKISFNREIEIAILDNGFYIAKRISKKQFTIQREIIKDFLEKKIKIDHIESLLIKPENIKRPRVAQIIFNNPDLQKIASNPNNNQVMAVRKAVGNQNIFLIQGPPGTGKTTVIAEIIDQLTQRGEKILVAGQNHVAVDNVLEKIAKNPNLSILRVGNRERISPDLVRFCIDDIIEDYKVDFKKFIKNQAYLAKRFLKFKKQKLPDEEIGNLYVQDVNNVSEKYGRLKERYRSKHLNLKTSLFELSLDAIEKTQKTLESWAANIQNEYEILLKPFVYSTVDVVFATCIGIKTDNMFKELSKKFDAVIIDEAGKANIAESLVAMELGKRVILVGDQMQLPPYIDSTLIDDKNPASFQKSHYGAQYSKDDIFHALKTSFFEFIINRIKKGQFPPENLELLNYQHRMHPNIGNFVSSSFYEGKVNMGDKTHLNRLQLPIPLNKEIIFFDTSNSDSPHEQSEPPSIKNNFEAKGIADYVLPLLFENNVSPSNIAIIAPYKAQVSNILQHINAAPACTFKQIEVSTLDSFQGKEYDVIIFSFTRSSAYRRNIDGIDQKIKKVGFLDDARRLNVAFSRAKKKLILIGNAKYLSDPRAHFDELYDYTSLFNKLITLSKNDKIGNFISIADYMNKHKRKVSIAKPGDFFNGVIKAAAISKDTNVEYGKYIKTDSGLLLAPYSNHIKVINKSIKKIAIGTSVQGLVVDVDRRTKTPVVQILPEAWYEIARLKVSGNMIPVTVTEISWISIKLKSDLGLKGEISKLDIPKDYKIAKGLKIMVTVENYDYVDETIVFKITT